MYSRHNRRRMRLDPRNPDYLPPPDEDGDDAEPDDYLTDDELDYHASQRENDWRPAL